MRFSVSARDGEGKARKTRAKQARAKQARCSLEVVFMTIFVPEKPIMSAILRFGAERDLNELRLLPEKSFVLEAPYRALLIFGHVGSGLVPGSPQGADFQGYRLD
jgi:hypothetical protein